MSLEVTSVRRIELGYSAEDDLGLGDVDLVYKIGNGGERRKRVRSVADSGKKGEAVRSAPVRSLAAKMEWDLSEIDLHPGPRSSPSWRRATWIRSVVPTSVARARTFCTS